VTANPRAVQYGSVTLHDLEPSADHLCEDAVRGLSGPRKQLPAKYFYDERGAQLFEEICTLDAYYPTRTELAILRDNIDEIVQRMGPRVRLVEMGSGSGVKTGLLLEHLQDPVAYAPIDISRAQLVEFALATAERFPALEVAPVCADYTRPLALPQPRRPAMRTVAFFPGSTIGNFEPDEAQRFLERVARLCGPDGGLLVGVDLRKDPTVIERAYNDPEGVTAEFNLNVLARINRECGADFDLSAFRHQALFYDEHGRIEMRLVSRRAQTVRIPCDGEDALIDFAEGDFVTTEYSYKYEPDGFAQLVNAAGWAVERCWMDSSKWFSVQLLRRGGPTIGHSPV
jgi:dimethylhistidine N-methyltransferase